MKYAILDDHEIVDVEIYRNYLLILFKCYATGKVTFFEAIPGEEIDRDALRKKMRKRQTVGFNSRNFDIPIIYGAIAGLSIKVLKQIADDIIVGGAKPWDIERNYGFEIPRNLNHIDLIEVAPGQASLKIYNGRLHGLRMQDLPIEPSAKLAPEEMDITYDYCLNDLDATHLLFTALRERLVLRASMSEQYGEDLRSKSDAQVAEAVIKGEVSRLLGHKPEKPEIAPGTGYHYVIPDFIRFEHPALRAVLADIEDATFRVSKSGNIEMPKALADAEIRIGSSVYRMGIGGLHSSEKCAAYVADEDYAIYDRDVTSYYPFIIINQRLYPKHLGWAFQKVYRTIVDRRLAAKKAGDTVVAESLKITINGSFGKFGNRWSTLYSPNLLIQTTVTGQLSLLLLIERLEAEGIAVVSANTDGIVVRCHRKLRAAMLRVVEQWEHDTGFGTEEAEYAALYSRDVNNYVAIKPDGKTKLKGAYAPAGFQVNPANEIAVEAAIAHITKGASISAHVRACRDVKKFVTVRAVKGGATKDGVYLGKAIRWYYSTETTTPILYKNANKTGNFNKVARTDGAMPLMQLPESLPSDIDYHWYVREARSILHDIGFYEAV